MKFNFAGLGMAAALLTVGCTSPMFEGTVFEAQPKRDPEVARVVTNTQQMSLEFRQLSEQMTVLNRNQELLDARLAQFEAQVGSAVRTQDDVAALRRDLQAIRAERETLRKEITDDLAGRIEKIAARQQADINAARTTAARAAQGARAASGAATGRSGYEHKVERGQTLSEIARGYGKSLDVIMKANKISNPSLLREGQILFIPD
ncbi:MAG: LysM peptidoglycan-binding domain-containing protein [Kiritimatiellae bacterium]|nr:LysM peptidoglycan-binding domain-containing protein [Kiritimatiellia bacterium]